MAEWFTKAILAELNRAHHGNETSPKERREIVCRLHPKKVINKRPITDPVLVEHLRHSEEA